VTSRTSALAWAAACACLAYASAAHADEPSDPASPAVPVDPTDEPSFEAVAEVEAPARETTKHAIEGDALREIAGTRGDPLRAIEVMPGVGRTGIGDGTPRLRGSAGFDSVTLIDGAPVPILYHFGGLTSVIQPRLVERVTLYPGNFPVMYGRATGGVVTADVRSPRTDAFHAMVDLGTIDTSGLVEFPVGEDFSFAIAGRRSNIDFFFDAFAPEDAYDVVAAPVYYDYQALGEARFGPHVLRLFGYGSSDRIELLLSEPLAEEPALRGETGASIAFHRITARLDTKIDEDVAQRVQATYGVFDGSQNIAGTQAEFFRHDVYGRATWDAQLTKSLGVRAGFDVELSVLEGDYDGERPPQLEGDPGANQVSREGRVELTDTIRTFQPAAFVEVGLRPVAPLLLLPGVRVDYFSGIDLVTVDPRLAARVEVSRELTLKAGVGLFTQPPLYWETTPVLGNEDLAPTRAVQTSAGAEFRLLEDALALDIEGYHKQLFDRVVTTEGRTAPYFENDGEGRVFGVESSLTTRFADRFDGWLAYSLARSERRDHGGPYRLFDEDQTHALTVAGTYHFGDSGWQVGSRFRLVSGHPTTAIEGSVFDAGAGTYSPVFGPTNRERRPTFHQLDVRVEKKWSFEHWSLTGYLEVQNAYAAEHEEGTSYSYDYRQSEPVAGLPIFPNIGVRGEL
jgi:hypothetical protein